MNKWISYLIIICTILVSTQGFANKNLVLTLKQWNQTGTSINPDYGIYLSISGKNGPQILEINNLKIGEKGTDSIKIDPFFPPDAYEEYDVKITCHIYLKATGKKVFYEGSSFTIEKHIDVPRNTPKIDIEASCEPMKWTNPPKLSRDLKVGIFITRPIIEQSKLIYRNRLFYP